ncbi:hypothetical protein NPIL_474211 [Nephila pilipes]|uniref:Costars domain-containing protein n=1 Tax=Nephila pilipes TaxID=299642 RepID=A0A8X6R0Y6_NEPPI|nr:hypothetical protein NPIL_413891 [Nephila pilipes]GFU42572.1 hypothetical protein NPIL_474211 [Nephila pilipes]
MVAWILRFINNSLIPRNSQKCGILDSKEISVAEYAVVRIIQKESFVNEEGEKLKILRAFKDKNRIIWLKTKILYRPDSEDFKMPIYTTISNKVVGILLRARKHGLVHFEVLTNIASHVASYMKDGRIFLN